MVFDHLLDDGCIGIFPEGGSHDLLPLKAGVAVMALGAMDNRCNIKLSLWYELFQCPQV